MEEVKFYAKCIFPTSTFKGGEYYEVINEEDYDITVMNSNGNKVKVARYRFDKIVAKNVVKKENIAICVNKGSFRNLTKNKEYKIINETKTRYNIVNDIGKEALYSKTYFEKKEVKATPVVAKEQKGAICLYPVADELSFRKNYKIVEEKERYVTVINDKKEKAEYFKKRFKINK